MALTKLVVETDEDKLSIEGIPSSLRYHSSIIVESSEDTNYIISRKPEGDVFYFTDPRDERQRTVHYFVGKK